MAKKPAVTPEVTPVVEEETLKLAVTPVVETPKFSAEGGKGKKMCPACNMFVGARVTGKCPNPACTHEFKQAEAKEKKPAVQQELDFGEFAELMGKIKKYADGDGDKHGFGGVSEMLCTVREVSEIAMQCGGLEGLINGLIVLQSLQPSIKGK